MKRLRIYVDTSVVNFLYADDAPDFRDVTREFFDVYAARYDLYASDIVLLEIRRDPDERHRAQLVAALRALPVTMIAALDHDEVRALAAEYITQRVLPRNKEADAFHVACATIHNMDILLSWNFKHLANVNKEHKILRVNARRGYPHALRLCSPLEVEYEEE